MLWGVMKTVEQDSARLIGMEGGHHPFLFSVKEENRMGC